ncbi:MAG: hypothetical protein NTY37_13275 [Methanothrix sp.]|nr:hypothetical protein [Methanothrix sp.]
MEFLAALQHRYPCGAVGSSARLPLDRGCPACRCARGLPPVGLARAAPLARAGRFARKAIASGGRRPVEPRSRAHDKARSREVQMINLATSCLFFP